MPIYDKPVRLLFLDMIDGLKFSDGRLVKSKEIKSWFSTNYPKINPNTVNAHLTKMTTNARARVWHKVDPNGSHDIFFRITPGEYRLYNPATDPPPVYPTQNEPPASTPMPVANTIAKDGELSTFPSEDELDRRRRKLIRILKSLDESEQTDDGPGMRLGRLRRNRMVPRHIASLMSVVLEYRNALVYDDYKIGTKTEALAVNSAWTVIDEWARRKGLL